MAVRWLEQYYGYYRRSIRDALTRSSRKPFQCGGLQGYDQLVGIARHLATAPQSSDPYLQTLYRRVHAALAAAHQQAAAVREARACLVTVERLLAQAARPALRTATDGQVLALPGSHAIQRRLVAQFTHFGTQAGLGATGQRLYRKWQQMAPTWLPDILQCYDVPGLPRSILDLEALFGTLRAQQRRVSGRKETTPLRIFGSGEIMAQILEDDELLPWLQSVPRAEYWRQRRSQEEREAPRRWLRRLRRDPEQALAQLDAQFYAVVKGQARASLYALVRDG